MHVAGVMRIVQTVVFEALLRHGLKPIAPMLLLLLLLQGACCALPRAVHAA
jgi:hypothetical protein